MSVTFHKLHGAGNDFVLLDLRSQTLPIDADVARRLARRHTGIGCDQLLVLRTAGQADRLAAFEVWNADGSRAEQCGNGVRCIGLYLEAGGETADGPFKLEGPVNVVTLESRGNGQFRVDMGPPAFEPSRIPVDLDPEDGVYRLDVSGRELILRAVSMGNPHAIIEVADLENTNVPGLGAAISTHPAFPGGCNAGFVQIVDSGTINLRVYERGAAETLACGSGACAAVAALIRAGKLSTEVLVNQKGGSLVVEWTGKQEPVMMTGPAAHTFTGMLE